MRNVNVLVYLFAIAGTFFLTSCGEDDPMTSVDPTLSITDGTQFDNSVLNAGDTISLRLSGMGGSEQINTLTFFEDGVRLPNWENRLFINNEAAGSNLLTLDGDSKDQFLIDVDILADSTEGEHELVIEIVDDGGTSASVSLNYITYNVDTIMGVLLNSAGPAGTGGLDLDAGMGSGSSDDIAEIRDLGIDASLPADENWLQQIAPANDAELAQVNAEVDYDAVVTSAGIVDAFDGGTSITETSKLEGGEVLAVKRGDSYYLIRIVAVNVVTTDNSDNYVIDIKKTR